MSDLEFGCKVSISGKYVRISRSRNKEYVAKEFSAKGIFLGHRTITNGYTVFDNYDGPYWVATSHMRVALVCVSPNENPIYVPIEAVSYD